LRGLQQAVHLEKSVSTGQGSCHGQHAAPSPSTRRRHDPPLVSIAAGSGAGTRCRPAVTAARVNASANSTLSIGPSVNSRGPATMRLRTQNSRHCHTRGMDITVQDTALPPVAVVPAQGRWCLL
jgi:hypothetical protein